MNWTCFAAVYFSAIPAPCGFMVVIVCFVGSLNRLGFKMFGMLDMV